MSTATTAGLRHLRKDTDLTFDELTTLLELAGQLKATRHAATPPRLAGRTIAVLFEKPSTRTRSAFEVAAYDEGAHCTYIDPANSHLGATESVEDTARVLGRYYDGIAFRGFAQASVDTLAVHAGVPVWNALTDTWHPTQALADLLTIHEHHHAATPAKVCFVGDGNDNVVHSLLVSGALRGLDVRVACPAALRPDPGIVQEAHERATRTGGKILVTDDIDEAVRDADFLYADVWVSMGEPPERWAERVPLLHPYRIDRALVDRTGNPDVKILHCLPALHDRHTTLGEEMFTRYGLDGAEISDDVFRSARSVVFDQAENRLHTIKAVLLHSLTETG
ncbi:ornithine carbamoyltransferase [Leifsonia xyli subsp. cynodontis DSM 46306]|uniref:Ornithine carbamoyltransferase n=1 Tax=Leifsonia xyli subsp. cynodontis DSM 46306 TaxID=1389489 RepID=U3PC37_LEIXC|nr:ornithine carbamoyltransferase [Leifsonia xyli]AGW41083.1 ornithine carbamoyltransferase [Leifsonia xyli subsp. cynodontis DSM 46306]